MDYSNKEIHFQIINLIIQNDSTVRDLLLDKNGSYIVLKALYLSESTQHRRLFNLIFNSFDGIQHSTVGQCFKTKYFEIFRRFYDSYEKGKNNKQNLFKKKFVNFRELINYNKEKSEKNDQGSSIYNYF